jgi:hypothetical protein
MLNDHLVNLILDTLRKEPASTTERWQALVRVGRLAEAYSCSDEQTREAVFGSVDGLLHQDDDQNTVGSVGIGNRAH